MKPVIRSYLFVVSIVVWICVCLIIPSLVGAQDTSDRESGPSNPTPAAPIKTNGTQLVSIDFNNVDIGVFIKFISDLTNRNFIVDDKVRGKVTIISPGKITVAEAYKVFESVLEVYGYATVRSGAITKIIPSPDARSKDIKTRLREESGTAGDTVITQIIPLRYADPNEIKTLFTPLISKSSIIQAYPPTNTLIVTDVHSNIQRLLKILKAIDITGVGQQIAIIPVENASAAKLVTLLQTIFRSNPKAKRTAGSDITFVADERTNVIVMLASEGEVDNVRQLVKSLDLETPKGQGNINVYYLEHATAEDVAKVLQDIPQKGADTKEGGKPSAPIVSSRVRIAADKATNSLIITADMEDYIVLESIIKKIDIPRAMVYIEALIMEVNVSKNFQLGTEWQAGAQTSYNGKEMVYGGGFKGEAPLYSLTPTGTTEGSAVVPSLSSGFSLGLFGEFLTISGIKFPSITAVINAYKKDSDVRILSTPQILTTDNQEAKIYVGKNVPFQTQATLSTSSVGEVYNSYEYRDVGKTLKITPQISKDRMVRLALSLEVTALESEADNRPTTLKRTVETTAIVKDGNTIVLGGLIDDTEGATNYKVPCLGDIPGFGLLFRSRSTAFAKSNLYVFLTPRVIQNPDEAEKVSVKKRYEIDNIREKNINLYDRKNEPPPLEELQIPAPQMNDSPKGALPPPSGSSTGNPSSDQTSKSSGLGTAAPRQEDTVTSDADADDSGRIMNNEDTLEEASESSGEVQGYTLQVASVKLAEKANQLLQNLTGKGYAAYTVRSEIKGAVWYRVRIGYFADKNAAAPVIDQLEADQYTPILIKL